MKIDLPSGFVAAILGLVLAVPAACGIAPAETTRFERISQLVRQLGHEDYSVREAATRELVEIGEPALAVLQSAAAADDDPEIRWRAAAAAQTVSGRARAAATRKALEELQGAWTLVSFEADGKQTLGEDKSYIFAFRGDKWSIHVGGRLSQGGTVASIEVKEKFNAIDLAITEGGGVGVTAISIYAVEGNTLKYLNCAEPRATEFTTRPGDGRSFSIFRRAKR